MLISRPASCAVALVVLFAASAFAKPTSYTEAQIADLTVPVEVANAVADLFPADHPLAVDTAPDLLAALKKTKFDQANADQTSIRAAARAGSRGIRVPRNRQQNQKKKKKTKGSPRKGKKK